MNWRNLEVVSKNAGFVHWTERHFVPKDWFERYVCDFDLWMFTQGSGWLRDQEGTLYPLRRGSLVLLRPGAVYEAWQEPGAERVGTYWFHLDLLAKREKRRLSPADVEGLPFYHETFEIGFFEAVAKKIVSLFRKRQRSGPEAGFDNFEEGVLAQMLLMEMEREARHLAERNLKGVDLHYHQVLTKLVSEIYEMPEKFESSAQLAKACGYSVDHFTRIFRHVIGQAPTKFLINARIEKAKSLLVFSNLGVGQIAEQVGYRNIYFFSRQFRQQVGMSPNAFRNQGARGEGGGPEKDKTLPV